MHPEMATALLWFMDSGMMDGFNETQQQAVVLSTRLLGMLPKPEQMKFFKELSSALVAFKLNGRVPSRPAFLRDKYLRHLKERYARASVAECVVDPLCVTCGYLLDCAPKKCGACRSVVYCSRECQMRDWKSGKDPPRGTVRRPGEPAATHKMMCPFFKTYMGKKAPYEDEYREAFKSWYQLAGDGTFCVEKVLIDLGLAPGGKEKGYWGDHVHSQHLDFNSDGLEDFLDLAFGTDRYFSGWQLLEEAWPTEMESWHNLPAEHIPRYAFSEEGPPAPQPPTHFFSSWLDYYDWRGLPHDSPVSLLLHFPLTVYHMLAQTLGTAAGGLEGLKGKRIVLQLLGPERELSLLPTFRELALLLPGVDLHILMLGPSVMNLYGRREERLKKDGKKTMILGDASRSEAPVLTYQAPKEAGGGSVEISLWGKGGRWPEGFGEGQAVPDLILAMNAGLATYNTWNPSVHLAHNRMPCPFVATDYMESSLDHAKRYMLPPLLGRSPEQLEAMCPSLPNPFRRVGQVPDGRQYMPRYHNGFYMILPPRYPR